MSNLGWMFYKGYFSDLDYNELDNPNNKKIIQEKIKDIIGQSIKIEEDEKLGNIHFKATTTYPGLILGSGNAHELPSIEGQAILGFHFDYTSGLPVIQGSSIKGVIRSAFEHVYYIEECLNDKKVNIDALEREIFDNGDIFFDATIIKGSKILGDDYITPHGDDPLKNPIPLRFIKVLPNIEFRFDFELSDGILFAEEKALLFAQILSDLGVGAKTNVGYGKFNSNLVDKAKREIDDQKKEYKKQEEDRKEKEKAQQEKEELENLDSNLEKISIQIKDYTKQNTKEIYKVIEQYSLSEEEKKELIQFLKDRIGEKPKPKNKAWIKWAIKIYNLLEV